MKRGSGGRGGGETFREGGTKREEGRRRLTHPHIRTHTYKPIAISFRLLVSLFEHMGDTIAQSDVTHPRDRNQPPNHVTLRRVKTEN